MKRRGFLKEFFGSASTLALFNSTTAASTLLAEASAEASDFTRTPYADGDFGALSIIQGVTGPTFTQVNVTLPKGVAATYRLVDLGDGRVEEPSFRSRCARDDSDWAAENIGFENLSLGREYALEVADAAGTVLDRRTLRTVDLDDCSRGFAVVSCANDSPPKAQRDEMWDTLVATRPSMTFFIGDNVYGAKGANAIDPKELWRRYVEVRQLKHKFYHSRELIPVIAIWDDHDYGINNGDGNYKHKHESLKIFNALYAQKEVAGLYERGPGCASWYRAFGLHFQLMDGRFHKKGKDARGNRSQWGAEGEAWLESALAQTDCPVFLFNGTMFFGTMPFAENYQVQFNKSFESMMDRLSRFSSPVVFVSGDVHWSEIQKIPRKFLGYETFEIVSSGLSANRNKVNETLLPLPNPWRLKGAGAYKNLFTLITPTRIEPRSLELDIAALTYGQRVEYRKQISIGC